MIWSFQSGDLILHKPCTDRLPVLHADVHEVETCCKIAYRDAIEVVGQLFIYIQLFDCFAGCIHDGNVCVALECIAPFEGEFAGGGVGVDH